MFVNPFEGIQCDTSNVPALGMLLGCCVGRFCNGRDSGLFRAHMERKGQGYASYPICKGIQVLSSDSSRQGAELTLGQYILVFGVCYSFVLPFLKVAILTEWTRMFVPRGTHMKNAFFWGCMTVCFVQIGAGIATVIALNLQCIPHAAIWDITITDKQCFELYPLQVSSASIQLVSDIAILLLPQRVIWTLKMTWQKRLGVSVVFGLGLL